MFSEEIKQTIYIGFSLFLAAIVLGIVSLVINLRTDFATVRNQEIATTMHLGAYKDFNEYNNKRDVHVEEVIALITKYYDSGMDIYINAYGDEVLISKNSNISDIREVGYWQTLFEDNIKRRDRYWIGLVYDYQDVTSIGGPFDISDEIYTDITGIVILEANAAY